ncbi:hypothetical protein FACS189416_2020 [Bacteroidia bacterium]|nr:hypothetical protein FACS189416_2020 [Bacteroidia bacterium]
MKGKKNLLFTLLLLSCNTLFSQSSGKTLKDALKGKFYIGTALNLGQISGKDVADIDVIKQNFNAINPYTEGVPDSASTAWTNRMSDFFKLFLKYPGKVSRVTMWGVTDGGSWKNGFPVRGRTDYPLLFDRKYQAKPVVAEIIRLAGDNKK